VSKDIQRLEQRIARLENKQAAVQLYALLYPNGVKSEALKIRGMKAIQRTILEYGFDEVLVWDSAKYVRFRSSSTEAYLNVYNTDLMRNIILRKLGGRNLRITNPNGIPLSSSNRKASQQRRASDLFFFNETIQKVEKQGEKTRKELEQMGREIMREIQVLRSEVQALKRGLNR